jgi:hypothetical protein
MLDWACHQIGRLINGIVVLVGGMEMIRLKGPSVRHEHVILVKEEKIKLMPV